MVNLDSAEQKAKLDQFNKLNKDLQISRQQRIDIENSKKMCLDLVNQLQEQKQMYEDKLRDQSNQ